MFEKIKNFFEKRSFSKYTLIIESALFSLLLMFLELFFQFMQKMEFTGVFWYHIIFMIPLGFFFAGFCSLFKEKINCIIATVIASLSGIWLLTQTCYHSVFQVYMELSKTTMAGDVAGAFGNEALTAIWEAGWQIIAVILIVTSFSLALFYFIKPRRKKPLLCLIWMVLAIGLHFICYATLGFNQQAKSTYKEYPRIIDNCIESFGYNTTLRLEIKDLFFSHNEEKEHGGFETEHNIPFNDETTSDDKVTTDITDETTQFGDDTTVNPPEPVKDKNIIDVDFEKANKSEKNEKIKTINNYVKTLPGSNTNEYTGYFEGYNLIMICAESFSDRMISKELTPTLYELSTNGFVFNNYYGSMKSITTNGEYAMLTGLIPQTVGGATELKTNSTFLASVGKYLPFSMANVFNELGATTCAYHGHSSTYYHRAETHQNLGYKFLRFSDMAIENGTNDKTRKLKFSDGNLYPSSDYELAKQTLDDYLSIKNEDGSVKQFHAYYMTYSGHHPYYDLGDTSHKKNPQSWTMREIDGKWSKNSVIDQLDYNEIVKTYIACNMQLEMMCTEIVNRLKDAGCLEKTVIVLTNDHYPYGLTDANFKNLAGKSVNTDFGIYENCFICYNAGMKEPVVSDVPCCTFDIMPTLLNLFGVDYDSRLLAGTDILDSKSFHVAMLYNKNFITDKIKYKSSNGKITYIADKSSVTEDYVNSCIAYVKNKFEISLQIINNDYYKVFFDYVEKQK